MELQGIIRKINIGDIKDGMTYKVGQEMNRGRLLIESILKDQEALLRYGCQKFDIYVSEMGSTNIRIWKSFVDMPVAIEYDLSIEHAEAD